MLLLFKANILSIELSLNNSKRVLALTNIEGYLNSFTYRLKNIKIYLIDLVTSKIVSISIDILVTINFILNSLILIIELVIIIDFSENNKKYSIF